MTELLDGRTLPWDFISGDKERVVVTLPPPVRRQPTPQQATRRRLIAGGIWRRP